MSELWKSSFDAKEDVQLESGNIFCVYKAGTQGPFVVLIHGAGYTALTWSLCIRSLKDRCRIIAFDLRGHGDTHTKDDTDLSIQTLTTDAVEIIKMITSTDQNASIVLVGHSLGGSIAVRTAARNELGNLVGVMVIDVVEGTAISSLQHMNAILDNKPTQFASVQKAIDWSLQSGTIRNAEAAQISVPSQVVKDEDGSYRWRTDLKKKWFEGLSDLFLSLSIGKLLILAGFDRLDTALTRGQMQGKFELRLLYGSGHVIQENCPEKLSAVLVEFLERCCCISANAGGNSNESSLQIRLAKARAMIPKTGSAEEN
ncbi:hypothetical protein ABG067_006484 [Albugo candida]